MRYEPIPNSFFINNRKSLMEGLKPGSAALLFGAHQMPRNGDQYYPYRQQSDFFYLTGIEQEMSILLLMPNAGNNLKAILFILKSNKTLEIWEGHKLSKQEASDISGIKTVKYFDEFQSYLHSIISEISTLYFNLNELQKFNPKIQSRDSDYLSDIKLKYPLHKFERLAPILKELRLIKQVEEIEQIKHACSITKRAFTKVLSELNPLQKEYEVEALISYEFIKGGANGHAYAPIVASGKNACYLHYIDNDKTCSEGELLLLDFGAEFGNYAADCSRTIPVSGKFSDRQKEVYEATLRVFKYARSLMRPGTTINQVQEKVCEMWEEEHIKLGLYSDKQALEQKNLKSEPLWFKYYMHGIGHFLGLDVHDVGSKETELKAGMILTCEPGIYILDEGIGIRIENNILITETGNVDLMADYPIEIDEIEALMAKQ